MSTWQLSTPIAFLVFNRPDTTERVFNEIAKAKPPKLLVVADGPRPGRPDEAESCAKVREIIKQVDWQCDVLTNISEVNLGCKNRISSGIDWVFEQVPEAIILEDDCLPQPEFFRFCEELLDKYRYDDRVSMIAGSNLIYNQYQPKESYFFSKYSLIWGWASWRRAWKDYDVTMHDWPENKQIDWYKKIGGLKFWQNEYWRMIFDDVYASKINTWDYQWTYTNFVQGRLCIVPAVNLIDNIGFGANATHTTDGPTHWMIEAPAKSMEMPLVHPSVVSIDRKADHFLVEACFGINYTFVINKVLRKIPFAKSVYQMIRRVFRSIK